MTQNEGECPRIVARTEWKACPAKESELLTVPVPYVIIHHTHRPAYSENSLECEAAMRGMQKYHQENMGWDDIGYNFAIGGDGRVYEGRGWTTVGAHALSYNRKSIGITFIGDYCTEIPTPVMLTLGQQLIAHGVATGMISEDYKLLGHRQTRDTECPGEAFYNVIKAWPHWDPMIDIQGRH